MLKICDPRYPARKPRFTVFQFRGLQMSWIITYIVCPLLMNYEEQLDRVIGQVISKSRARGRIEITSGTRGPVTNVTRINIECRG